MPPISPQEAKASQAVGKSIPPFVFEIVDGLITKHYSKHGFDIKKDDVVLAIMRHQGVRSRSQLPEGWIHWLDFEPVYRSRGWKVSYDQPAYCESFPAFYRFSEKPKDDE